MMTYAQLRASNVLGTRWLLRLAATTRLKPLHFVSTISTCETGGRGETDLLSAEQARGARGTTPRTTSAPSPPTEMPAPSAPTDARGLCP